MMYRVRWEIDIEASSAREAAEQALKIQRDPLSIATVFDVHGEDWWPDHYEPQDLTLEGPL